MPNQRKRGINMYIKIENRNQGKRFTFFSREREINGEKVNYTEKSVFASLSEGVKVGEKNGQAIWENDYWNTLFCGKAYEKARTLKNKDKICVIEMNVRNLYFKNTKKSYPQIMVTDFDVISNENSNDVYMNVPDSMDEDLPFN